jgi:hypothetical protein
MKKPYIGMAVATQMLIIGGIGHAQTNPGVFWSWTATQPTETRWLSMPYPQYGWDGTGQPSTQTVHGTQIAAGDPTAILLLGDNAPYSGTTSKKGALDWVLGWSTSLNYVLADIEKGHATNQEDMKAMVDKVRAASDVDVKNAYVGNYAYFKSTNGLDVAKGFPSQMTMQADNDAVYDYSGVNVAMPTTYPYSSYMRHSTEFTTWASTTPYGTTGLIPADYQTPNQRSALFWTPLEKLSQAKRGLPAGHKLIPWTAVWWPNQTYNSVIPEKADAMALIKHYRMRGADGIYEYRATDPDGKTTYWTGTTNLQIPTTSWLYNYTESDYRTDIVDSWDDLDSMFGTPIRTLLNVNTSANSGVYWSGVRSVNDIKILVSNLSGAAATVDLAPTEYANANGNGLPATTTSVANNTHQLFTYTLINLLGNGRFNTNTDGWLLRPGTTRVIDAVTGSGVMRFQNSAQAMVGTTNLRVEPGVKMSFAIEAKGVSSPNLILSYYYYDKDGTQLGYQNVATHSSLPTSFTSYSTTFNVLNNPDIKYIRPFLSNQYGPTDSNDVIFVDNFYVKFAS